MNAPLLIGQLVVGAVTGGGYAVIAIGLSYTLGLARVMNFAFGTFYMLAAFVTAYGTTKLSLAYPVAGVLTVVAAVAGAWVLSWLVVLPALPISEAAVMIATLGAGVVLTNLAQALFGAEVAFITTPLGSVTYHVGPAAITAQAILVLALAPLISAALTVFMNTTALGMRIRATAESPSLASATGVDVPSIQTLAVCIGIALAALAAVLYAPVGVISVFMGDSALLTAFAITALAGIGRIWGALIVAIGVGVFESLIGAFVSSAYSTAAIYGLLVVALLFFPRGLFRGH